MTLVDIRLQRKDIRAGRYSDLLYIQLRFHNKTDTAITAIKGAVAFRDVFDDEIKTVRLKVDSGFPAKKDTDWFGTIELNQFHDGDRKLASTDQSKMRAVWLPEVLLLDGGKKLEAGMGGL
jgi:hypothetical protein